MKETERLPCFEITRASKRNSLLRSLTLYITKRFVKQNEKEFLRIKNLYTSQKYKMNGNPFSAISLKCNKLCASFLQSILSISTRPISRNKAKAITVLYLGLQRSNSNSQSVLLSTVHLCCCSWVV